MNSRESTNFIVRKKKKKKKKKARDSEESAERNNNGGVSEPPASEDQSGIVPQVLLEGARMVKKSFTVNLNKPLVSQVGHLGEAYDDWVHQAIISKEGPRLFESDILEFFTKTPWWMIPIIWLPIASWFVSKAVRINVPLPQIATSVVGGLIFWTLLEYSLHRFLFHIKTSSYWGNTMHYLLHGCHHKHPMDGLRLVFPPVGAVIIASVLWCLLKLILPPSVAPAFFGGTLLGYIMYDCTHYFLHHGKPEKGFSSFLKRYHMNHHYKLHELGFGITSNFWDVVFGTLPPCSGKKIS